MIWGDKNTDKKRKLIENSYFFNSNIYLHSATGTFIAIDIALYDQTSFMDFNWQILLASHGSDHFPVIFENNLNVPEQKI